VLLVDDPTSPGSVCWPRASRRWRPLTPLEGELPAGCAFLPKLFTLPELSAAVRGLLSGPPG
jgi:hypothetical protein